MRLYFERDWSLVALNANFRNSEGQPLYRADTPFKFHHRKTTISRIEPEFGINGKGRLTELAQIHWHLFDPSKLVQGGKEKYVRDYVSKDGVLGW